MSKIRQVIFAVCVLFGSMACVYAYNIYNWQCLNCGQKVQMAEPMLYGCPKGQYGKHAWVQTR
ncbi:MAG: hypothetical protein MJ048_02740 [Acidaminococcaceae bacterium]|nr:hypothetical protein [Acidaminococcaceae bacterium]